jgi:hypothetical protein
MLVSSSGSTSQTASQYGKLRYGPDRKVFLMAESFQCTSDSVGETPLCRYIDTNDYGECWQGLELKY